MTKRQKHAALTLLFGSLSALFGGLAWGAWAGLSILFGLWAIAGFIEQGSKDYL